MQLKNTYVLFARIIVLIFVPTFCKAETPTCGKEIPDDQKLDCHPDVPILQDQCLKRGCCWEEVSPNYLASTGLPPSGVPNCYFPLNYVGYEIVTVIDTTRGHQATLQRVIESGFIKDVQRLNLELTILDENSLRIKITDSDSTSDRFEVPLSRQNHEKYFEKQNLAYEFSIGADDNLVVTRKSTGTVVFNTDLNLLVFSDQLLQISSTLPSATIYGIGEKYAATLRDVNWARYTLFNRDNYPAPNINLYGSHPFYVCVETDGNSHGVLLLNSNSMDVILQPMPAVTFRTIGGILDLFIFLGPSPDSVVQQYSQIVGNTFMPPYWSLGFHLCRYNYNSLDKTREVWQRTRDARIPFDVQWNDIDYMERHNDFTYDKVAYKELPEFVKVLHDNGMHYIIIFDAGVSGSEPSGTYAPLDDGIKQDIFIKNSTGDIYYGKVWNDVSTVFPDFSHPSSTSYWIKQFQDFHNQVPFDGAWIDMNEIANFLNGTADGCPDDNSLNNPQYLPGGREPLWTSTLCMTAKLISSEYYNERNLFPYRQVQATYTALAATRGKRPFVISRASTTGYGAYGGHWSGDISSTWEDLRYSVRSLLEFNIYGIPMIGSDICGFKWNTTEELCARWSTLGAFYPFSRNHNDFDTIEQDPVAMGPIVTKAARKSLLKRYALLPHLYTLFYRSHAFGETVVRPLAFEYPQDPNTYPIDETFLWGCSFLVVPALYEGVSSVTAYFPKDLWYDFSTGKVMPSMGENFTLSAPITDINLFVRGGSILPMQEPGLTTTESRCNPFILFAALNSTQEAFGELYWDDGDSIGSYERKEYNLIRFSSSKNELHTEVVFRGYETPMPLKIIRICGLSCTISNVEINGENQSFKYDECLYIRGKYISLLNNNLITWN